MRAEVFTYDQAERRRFDVVRDLPWDAAAAMARARALMRCADFETPLVETVPGGTIYRTVGRYVDVAALTKGD
ncbi:hypothetical protein [Azospirillum argentinense]|uniref:hypothetical protein n=1 Tax=Azospirillum argentinense TaxID=2970906 RepID=UPI0032DF27BC